MTPILQLFAFLARTSRELKLYRTMILVLLTGGVSGLGGAGLMMVLNRAIGGGATTALAWDFFGLVALVTVTGLIAQWSVAVLAAGAVFELRVLLARRILGAPIRRLETIGVNRLYAHLTDDVEAITAAFVELPMLFIHGAIVTGCFLYIGWLSLPALLAVMAFLIFGIFAYRLPLLLAGRGFTLMRARLDSLFQHFRGLTLGLKELKLHRRRRQAFMDEEFIPTAGEIRDHGVRANLVLAVASWGSGLLFFGALGLFVFIVPRYLPISGVVVTGFILTMLYMKDSLRMLLSRFAVLSRALVAVRRVEDLEQSLAQAQSPASALPARTQWRSLRLEGVTHRYYREQEDSSFVLGPIDLELQPGEIHFLVGGNGSGKTTLAKIFVGLYEPEAGQVRLDGEVVTAESREAYMQLFSAVFSDFFLFESLLGLAGQGQDLRAREYLDRLHLGRKVTIEDGRLSTLELSQGQRKRLALLTAYLEDRPIYLFDEWAADQDPEFKEVFYRSMLPELKARGKTLVVISHDDRYYDVADRVIKLEDGKARQWVSEAGPAVVAPLS